MTALEELFREVASHAILRSHAKLVLEATQEIRAINKLLSEALSIIKEFMIMFSENDKAVNSGLIEKALAWITKARFSNLKF